MKQYQITFILSLSVLISACASTSTSYFEQVMIDKPHALVQFEMSEKVGLLLDVRVANTIPSSINGMPINTWTEGWKLHAFGDFLIPVGDTIIFLSYSDRDTAGYGYVRFGALQGEVYKITHVINTDEDRIGFKVSDAKGKLVTLRWFKEKKHIYASLDVAMASALFEASAAGNLEKVESLLLDGADPDWIGPRGFTSLIIAASNGYKKIVRTLIKAGANVNAGADWTALTFAADRGYEGIVKLLLDSGAYIDFRMPNEYSALMAAAESGHVDIVKLLLKKGAYLYTRNRDGKTSLDLARDMGNKEIIYLLEKPR